MNPNNTTPSQATVTPKEETVTPQVTTPPAAPSAQTTVKNVAPQPVKAVATELERELGALKDTIGSQAKTMLDHLESSAAKMGVLTGGALSTAEINACQNDIFVSVISLITKTPNTEFNAVMYAIADIFKRHSASRVGGLAKERVFMDIGYNAATNSAQWAHGRSTADLTWFRTFVTAMHMAHERGATALKQINIATLFELPVIKQTNSAVRLKEWFASCKPL